MGKVGVDLAKIADGQEHELALQDKKGRTGKNGFLVVSATPSRKYFSSARLTYIW